MIKRMEDQAWLCVLSAHCLVFSGANTSSHHGRVLWYSLKTGLATEKTKEKFAFAFFWSVRKEA
jgi:hypothetical protein